MPQSIYDNGGMIGATLDFSSTERYVIGGSTETPSVVGSTSSSGGSSLSLTGISNLAEDDVVFFWYSDDNNGTDTVTSSGWNEIVRLYSNSIQHQLYWKRMGVSPDSSVSISTTVDALSAIAIRGIADPDPTGISSIATGSSATIDTNPVTVDDDDSIVLVFTALDDDSRSSFTPPSGYTFATADGRQGGSNGIAYKTGVSAGTEDPGALTWPSSDAILAYSFPCHRAITYGNQKNSGIWSLSSVLESIEIANEFTFINSSIGTTSVTIPTEAQDGDLGLLLEYSSNSNSIPTDVTETGFTQLTTQEYNSGNDFRMSVSYKILSTSDANTTLTGLSGSNHNNKMFLLFRSLTPPSSIDIFDVGFDATTGTPGSISLTATEKEGIFFFLKGAYGGSGDPTINISGIPTSTQINTTTDSTGRLGAEFYPFAENYPSVVGSTADDGNAQMFLGFYLVGVA